MENGNSSEHLGRLRSFLGRPFAGPLFFGLLLGGVPFGILLGLMGPAGSDDRFFGWLIPVLALIAAIGAVVGPNGEASRLFWRAFLTSLSACVPIPMVTWTLLLWRTGTEILDFRNLPFAATVLGLLTLLVAVGGWLLALMFRFVRHRYSFTAQKAGASSRTP